MDAKSDGTCQVDAKTAALLAIKDPEAKMQIAKQETQYLVDNFELYENSFAYPHYMKVGLGKNVCVSNKEEFKEFLEKNPDAPFMWGDQMQLQIAANMHKVRINVLKVSNNGEQMSQPSNLTSGLSKMIQNPQK